MNFKTLLLVFLLFALMTPFLEASRKKHSKGKAVRMHHNYLRTSTACTTSCSSHTGYTNCGILSQSCCPSASCTGAWYSGYSCANGTALNITC